MSIEKNTWVRVDESNLEFISHVDLRDEAEAAIDRFEDVWLFLSGSCCVAYFQETERAGIVYNADAEWGDVICSRGEGGMPERFRLELAGEGDRGRRLVDQHGANRCCYNGCAETAHQQYADDDGDWCCEEHYSKGLEYVEIALEAPNALTDPAIARRYVRLMGDLGWSVEVSRGSGRDAEGTHTRNSDGTLRSLSSVSGSLPESYRRDSELSYNKACAG